MVGVCHSNMGQASLGRSNWLWHRSFPRLPSCFFRGISGEKRQAVGNYTELGQCIDVWCSAGPTKGLGRRLKNSAASDRHGSCLELRFSLPAEVHPESQGCRIDLAKIAAMSHVPLQDTGPGAPSDMMGTNGGNQDIDPLNYCSIGMLFFSCVLGIPSDWLVRAMDCSWGDDHARAFSGLR